MAEFLKNEYKTTGKGFDFGNNPISVWFNDSGMGIGYGMSARENPVAVMGWTEIEGVVRSMVEQQALRIPLIPMTFLMWRWGMCLSDNIKCLTGSMTSTIF